MQTRSNADAMQRNLYVMNLFIFAGHAGLLALFAWLHINVMVAMNIASVLCYLLCFLLLKKGRIMEYIITVFIEILTHTFLAVVSVGSGKGFEFFFIDCIAIIFFSDYYAAHLRRRSFGAYKLGFMCALLYVVALLIEKVFSPIYVLEGENAFWIMLVNSAATLAFVNMIFRRLTKVASSYEVELARQAQYDNLTGVMNRHYLVEHMNSVYMSGRMQRYWLAMLDIDDFKRVNDEHGHLCGDFVLKRIAEILTGLCGDRIVCRWGGEEFLVIGTVSGRDDGVALAEEIRKSIAAEEFAFGDTRLKLTVTIGLSYYQKGQTVDQWFSMADDRLYEGKREGKDRVIVG